VNSEVVAILGNFVNRVMVLTWKYFDGKVPSDQVLTPTNDRRQRILDIYHQAHFELNTAVREMATALKEFRFREAQFQMMNLSRIGNKFLADTEPWKLAKEDMEAVAYIMNFALTMVGNIALAAQPFLPDGASNIQRQLAVTSWDFLTKDFWFREEIIKVVAPGHPLAKPELLYKNIEDEDIEKQIARLKPSKGAAQPAPSNEQKEVKPFKPEIVIDDFGKLDIRVGTVLTAEKMEKSNKLLKLTVNDGHGTRTILSGIAQHYSPDEVVGKQVTFIANLAPRKMMGIESQGMILMAEDGDGKLRLVQPTGSVTPGSTVS
jgi:methionyl-tRNA synthetase